MKKHISIFIIFVFIFFTSCLPETVEPPYGVWSSENPNITLYLKDYEDILQMGFPWRRVGIYTKNEETLHVFPTFGPATRFNIRYNIYLSSGGALASTTLASGSWQLRNDQMYFNLTPHFQEQLGVRRIIFNRLEEYDPINPEDWITPEIIALIEDRERRARERQERIEANRAYTPSDE